MRHQLPCILEGLSIQAAILTVEGRRTAPRLEIHHPGGAQCGTLASCDGGVLSVKPW